MLKKLYRLPAKQKLKQTSFFRTPYFNLIVASNNLQVSRFGFTTKKSIDRRAVARNRAKRVLRSCIEEMLETITSGYDMLFLLEKGIIGKEREVIFTDLKKLFKEKRLLK
jgi:ribonuclease P protein component